MLKNDKQMGEKMLEFFNNKDLLNTYSKNAYDLMKNYWNYDLYINCLNKFIGKNINIKIFDSKNNFKIIFFDLINDKIKITIPKIFKL